MMNVQYMIPDYVHVSSECKQLLARIFVANPNKVDFIYFDNLVFEVFFWKGLCFSDNSFLNWLMYRESLSKK